MVTLSPSLRFVSLPLMNLISSSLTKMLTYPRIFPSSTSLFFMTRVNVFETVDQLFYGGHIGDLYFCLVVRQLTEGGWYVHGYCHFYISFSILKMILELAGYFQLVRTHRSRRREKDRDKYAGSGSARLHPSHFRWHPEYRVSTNPLSSSPSALQVQQERIERSPDPAWLRPPPPILPRCREARGRRTPACPADIASSHW